MAKILIQNTQKDGVAISIVRGGQPRLYAATPARIDRALSLIRAKNPAARVPERVGFVGATFPQNRDNRPAEAPKVAAAAANPYAPDDAGAITVRVWVERFFNTRANALMDLHGATPARLELERRKAGEVKGLEQYGDKIVAEVKRITGNRGRPYTQIITADQWKLNFFAESQAGAFIAPAMIGSGTMQPF